MEGGREQEKLLTYMELGGVKCQGCYSLNKGIVLSDFSLSANIS